MTSNFLLLSSDKTEVIILVLESTIQIFPKYFTFPWPLITLSFLTKMCPSMFILKKYIGLLSDIYAKSLNFGAPCLKVMLKNKFMYLLLIIYYIIVNNQALLS